MSQPVVAVLVVLLALTTREWLVLRARQRQRGLFRRWPIRRIPVDALDPRFRLDELGPTRDAEVAYIGRGTIRVPGGTSDSEAWMLAVLARDAQRLFEFGTCTGKTTYLWARNQPSGGTVTTLTLAPHQSDASQSAPGDDPVALAYARDESRFSRFLYSGTEAEGRIEQLYGDSKEFDAAAKALTMVRPGGLVLWHDYSPECPGVFRALNELARRLPLVHVEGTTLVAWRRGEE